MVAVPFDGCFKLSVFITSENNFLFSALSIFSGLVPMIGTPALISGTASFRGVCPPN